SSPRPSIRPPDPGDRSCGLIRRSASRTEAWTSTAASPWSGSSPPSRRWAGWETIRLVGTRANGQPALAAYETGDDGRPVPYGLMVLTLAADAVIEITGFPGVDAVEAVQPAAPGG